MRTVDGLIAARVRIAQGWCQRWWARDRLGLEVHSGSPEACYWCAAGAVNSTTNDFNVRGRAEAALNKVLGQDVRIWNDQPERTQAEVLALYDLTIERLTDDSAISAD